MINGQKLLSEMSEAEALDSASKAILYQIGENEEGWSVMQEEPHDGVSRRFLTVECGSFVFSVSSGAKMSLDDVRLNFLRELIEHITTQADYERSPERDQDIGGQQACEKHQKELTAKVTKKRAETKKKPQPKAIAVPKEEPRLDWRSETPCLWRADSSMGTFEVYQSDRNRFVALLEKPGKMGSGFAGINEISVKETRDLAMAECLRFYIMKLGEVGQYKTEEEYKTIKWFPISSTAKTADIGYADLYLVQDALGNTWSAYSVPKGMGTKEQTVIAENVGVLKAASACEEFVKNKGAKPSEDIAIKWKQISETSHTADVGFAKLYMVENLGERWNAWAILNGMSDAHQVVLAENVVHSKALASCAEYVKSKGVKPETVLPSFEAFDVIVGSGYELITEKFRLTTFKMCRSGYEISHKKA